MATRSKPRKKSGAKVRRQKSQDHRRTRTHAKSMRRQNRQNKRVRRDGRQRVSFRNTFAWRLIKGTTVGTVKGVAKYTPKITKAGVEQVKKVREKQRFTEDYEPEDGEIPPEKFKFRASYSCCERRFATPEALNRHHERAHANEEPQAKERERPELIISTTKRSAGARSVKPVAGVPKGRHRARNPNLTPAQALLEAHRDKFTEIGKAVMATDDTASHLIKRGFAHLIDGPLGPISQIECDFLGLEQALSVGKEAVKDYRMKMINRGYDPDLVVDLPRIEEHLEAASTAASAAIAHLKAELADAIRLAKLRQQGQALSDADLAG